MISLLQAGKLEWDKLAKFFAEILPRMGQQSLKQDPDEFEKNFRALEAKWRSAASAE